MRRWAAAVGFLLFFSFFSPYLFQVFFFLSPFFSVWYCYSPRPRFALSRAGPVGLRWWRTAAWWGRERRAAGQGGGGRGGCEGRKPGVGVLFIARRAAAPDHALRAPARSHPRRVVRLRRGPGYWWEPAVCHARRRGAWASPAVRAWALGEGGRGGRVGDWVVRISVRSHQVGMHFQFVNLFCFLLPSSFFSRFTLTRQQFSK